MADKVIGIEVAGLTYGIEDTDTASIASQAKTQAAEAATKAEEASLAVTETAEKVAQIEANIGETDISELKSEVQANTEAVEEHSEELPKINSAIEDLQGVLLWENPAPNASFERQTLNINTVPYKRVKIFYRDNIQPINNRYSNEIILNNGSGAAVCQTIDVDYGDDVLYINKRAITFNGLQAIVYEGIYWIQNSDGGQSGMSSDRAVPLAIYGYKGF